MLHPAGFLFLKKFVAELQTLFNIFLFFHPGPHLSLLSEVWYLSLTLSLFPFIFSLIASSLPSLCFVLSLLCLGPALSDRCGGGCGFVEISVCGGHWRLLSRLRCGSWWLLGRGIDESVTGLWESVTGLCGFGFWWVIRWWSLVCLVVESGLFGFVGMDLAVVVLVVLLDFRWWWLLCCGWVFFFFFFLGYEIDFWIGCDCDCGGSGGGFGCGRGWLVMVGVWCL